MTQDDKKEEFRFEDGVLRQLQGVQIFAVGEHTDSAGNVRIWTRSQLADIIRKFNEKIPSSVPIKLGHTSPEHTQAIADALKIPTEVLMGENGRGAARLGSVHSIALRKNGTLVADFQIAEGIANLVQSSMFNTVSAEIIPDYQGQGPVLSGVALLGADRPALKKLEGLQAATLSDEGGSSSLLYYSDYKFAAAQSTYTVPITQVDTKDGRTVNRVTTVQHVKADSESGARQMVMRILERTASGFGQVIGQGVGHIIVLIAATVVGREIERRYNVGNPFAIPAAGQMESADRSSSTITRRFRFTEDVETFSAMGMFLGIVGAYGVGKTLYRLIMENRQDGQPGHVDAWASTPREGQGLAQEKFSDEWKTIKQVALTGTALAIAKEAAKKLFAEDLHNFALGGLVSPEMKKPKKDRWKNKPSTKVFAEGILTYSADIHISNLIQVRRRQNPEGRPIYDVEGAFVNSASKVLGGFAATLMPDRKLIRIGYIEGDITVAGGRKLIKDIKKKYPWAREVSGTRISGAKDLNDPHMQRSGKQRMRWAEGFKRSRKVLRTVLGFR